MFDLGLEAKKDDVMLIDIKYIRPSKHTNWDDNLQIVYKVLSTGEKKVKNIANPRMNIYFAKQNYFNTYYKEYMPIEQLEMVSVPYKDREKEIATRVGGKMEDLYWEYRRNNRRAIREVHKHPNVYGSDYDIEEWYRIMWNIYYGNNKTKPITKGFLDIEVNIVKLKGFPKNGERPINVITVIDGDAKLSHTMILREPDNIENIIAFEENLESFTQSLHDMFDESYEGFDYNFYMYDDELEMLKDFILLTKTLNKDFYMIWNMDFDIPYINDRIVVLGGDPSALWSDSEFDLFQAWYNKSRFFDVVARDSRFNVSSKSVFLDQMTVYAAMRKGQGTLRSARLNAVGEIELGDEKLDYGEASNLGELQMIDFPRYIAYNIKDTLLQYGIECKTDDITSLYQRTLDNCISYHRAFKQTKFLENRAYLEYFKQGLIIGNNINIDYTTSYNAVKKKDGDEEESFAGGLVADPKKFGHNGIMLHGSRSKYILKNVVDFDFAAMYPNMIATFNISRTSMIGKLLIDAGAEDIYRIFQNVSDEFDLLERAGNMADKGHAFMEEYLTNHFVTLGKRWLNLPGTEELIKDAVKELNLDLSEAYENMCNMKSDEFSIRFDIAA